MKKFLTTWSKHFAIALTALIIFAFASSTEERKDSATVNRIDGYYIFVESKPTAEYDYLGDVKFTGTFRMGSTQYSEIRDKLIKRAKADYPRADGLIFTFSSSAADKCEAIKFK